MYSGYELFENQAARAGSEEYLHSEKFQYRPRDWSTTATLAPLITRVNAIRREHRDAVASLGTLRVHGIDNENLICVSRSSPSGDDVLVVIANFDGAPQEATTWLDLARLGLPADRPYEAHDLLTNTTYVWRGAANYVRLDPAVQTAHVLHLRPR